MEKKADFKTMKKSEIAGFIWDYYKWFIIIGIIVIAALIGTVRHFVNYREPVVQIELINCDTTKMEEEGKPDFTDFMEKYGYDTREEEVTLNTSFTVDLNSQSTSQVYSFQSFVALTAAGGVDLIAADEKVFTYIGECRTVASLEDFLPKEFLEKHQDAIVYSTNVDTDEQFPAGIRIPDNAWMKEHGFYGKDCVIGFGNGTEREEASVRMLLYLLGEEDQL